MMKDKAESARVGRLVRAKPKQCFRNAVRVARRLADCGGSGPTAETEYLVDDRSVVEMGIHGVVALKDCRGFCENEGDKEEFREHEDKGQGRIGPGGAIGAGDA